MDLKLQGRNLQIDDSLRDYVTKKLNRLERLLPADSQAEVEVSSSTTRSNADRITVQATLASGGAVLRAEQRAANANAAMDSVVDVLERKIDRFKSQTYRSRRARKGQSMRVIQAEEMEQPIDPREGDILADGTLLRVKRFEMDPMTVEEAAVQMDLVGHSFFMFLNDDTGQHNVLYRRSDGNYGLIQPE